MNSLERTWARLDGQPVDRLPALPIFMIYASDLIGAKYSDFCRDSRVLVDGNLALVDRYRIDVVSCCCYAYAETADCGAELEYHDHHPPSCRNLVIQEPADLVRLKRPNPRGGGKMTDRLKAIALYREKVGDTIPIQGWVEGPLAEATDLRGINELLLETASGPSDRKSTR